MNKWGITSGREVRGARSGGLERAVCMFLLVHCVTPPEFVGKRQILSPPRQEMSLALHYSAVSFWIFQ